jgi:hypothetical protein
MAVETESWQRPGALSSSKVDTTDPGSIKVRFTGASTTSSTGLAKIARCGPEFWLRIPIRGLNWTSDLGSPCACFVDCFMAQALRETVVAAHGAVHILVNNTVGGGVIPAPPCIFPR